REGGVWGDDEIIATTRTALDTLPELAVTALGDLVVAWDDWNGGLYARWRRIDGDGNAMITWTTDRASYDLAGEDRWIESELMLDTYLLRAAFAGSDPVVIGQQEGGAAPDVHVAIYR
ncbi:MAG TPA: hypothetical protein VFU21_14765, partial [Kofleriaceae bacterium]|nr:hypothetical protein [Kofleriaceae bacterium]